MGVSSISVSYFCIQVRVIVSSSRSNLELKPVGILEVKLVQAKNLANKDLIGKSDPYAVIFVRPLRARTKISKTIVRQPFFSVEAFFTFIYLLFCVVVILLLGVFRTTS